MLQKRDLGDAVLVINLMSQSNESTLHVNSLFKYDSKKRDGTKFERTHKSFRSKFNAVMSEILFIF